jgi:hypothetical protein
MSYLVRDHFENSSGPTSQQSSPSPPVLGNHLLLLYFKLNPPPLLPDWVLENVLVLRNIVVYILSQRLYRIIHTYYVPACIKKSPVLSVNSVVQ